MRGIRTIGRYIRDAVKSVIRNFSLSLASISCITIEREDDDLQRLLEMISRGDATEITSYLTENYLRNLGYAKFCTKHGVVHG